MSSPFENPFILKPDNLKPDSAEFLGKFAGASEDQLQKAGLAKEPSTASGPSLAEAAESLRESTSDEEKEAYLNEEVNLDGVAIKRPDQIKIQAILKNLNQDRIANGLEAVTLGKKIKIDRANISGQTKEQLKEALQKANIKISDNANDLLNSNEFEPLKEPEDTVLIKLSVGDLGFPRGATTNEIFAKAQELGLGLCPPETGPQLRVKPDAEQKFGEYFNIAMQPIPDSDDHPDVFYLRRCAGEPWLDVYFAWPAVSWSADDPFVFRIPK